MRFKLEVKNKITGAESVCSGEFTDDEWKILTEFREYSRSMNTALMIQNGWKSSPFGWSQERGFYSEDKTPDSHVRELLHLLRPFILHDERTSYFKVIKILSRRMDSDGVRAILNRWKDGFSQQISQSTFTVTANGLILNSDKAFFLWLNAFEYHRDRDKQAELEAALGQLPFEVARNIFINGIVEKLDSISRLSKFIWDIEHCSPGDSVGVLGGRLSW